MARLKPRAADMAAVGGETQRLAAFLAETRFDSLPAPVIAAAKTFTLDLLGCGLGAVKTAEARMAFALAEELGGVAECTVIGTRLRTNCQNAAFTNSLVAHVLELDDTHRDSITHVGAPVIPAALALAERRKTDGRTFLAAVVIGYEACLRVANAVQPSHWRSGFLSMGTCGTFGAAAAAAHCLGLNADQLANAFGLAGMQAAGTNTSIYAQGDMGKRLVPSHGAGAGVVAALLAAKGFTGSTNVIEGKFGFCQSFAREYDLARVTENMGEVYEITRTSLKPYSCCRYNHAPIDGLFAIMQAEEVTPEAIKAITIGTFDVAVTNRPHRAQPKTLFDAKMSIPFSLAVAAHKGRVGESDFTEDLIGDSAIQRLAAKVTVVADPAMSKAFPAEWPALVRVETTDGRSFERRIPYPKGEPEAPMSEAEVNEKFLGLAEAAMPRDRARRIIDAVQGLDRARDVNALCVLLSA